MRKNWVLVTWLFLCSFELSVLFHEYFNARSGLSGLDTKNESEDLGLPEDSAVLKIVEDEDEFYEYSRKTLDIRLRQISKEIITAMLLTVVSAMFIIDPVRKRTLWAADRQISIVGSDIRGIKLAEINVASVLLASFAVARHWRLVSLVLGYEAINKAYFLVLFVILILFVIPVCVTVFLHVLSRFGVSIIVILYLAYIGKVIFDFFDQNTVDLKKMEPVDIKVLAPAVQAQLKDLGLADRVYKERVSSTSLNAALVGWGAYERVEIYGDHSQFSEEQFNAVIMHEIGHEKDHSLFKKFFAKLAIYTGEMIAMVLIYIYVAPLYEERLLSQPGAFFIIATIFFFMAHHWLVAIHHCVSQAAETASDDLAKSKGYGQDLAEVLLYIEMRSKDYLKSSFLYNLLHSYHPSIYARIERLMEKVHGKR